MNRKFTPYFSLGILFFLASLMGGLSTQESKNDVQKEHLKEANFMASLDDPSPCDVFISEIHYDDAGGDENERVEIAAPLSIDLTGWSIVLYNGNGGASYATETLSEMPLR